MKFLIFGGSVFLSKAVAQEALRRGHEVSCLSRGDSGPAPEGAHHIWADRDEETDPQAGTWTGLASHEWDAVIDVARTPSWVQTALSALAGKVRHWTFVSSISVYADVSAPGGTPADTPTLPAAQEDLDDMADPTSYGRNKVACEQAVQQALPDSSLIARPGLVIGPGDPSGRYTYWPLRLARGGRVLAPQPPEAHTQFIDVRDLASWLVAAAERGVTGVYDTVGPSIPMRQMLTQTLEGVRRTMKPGTRKPPIRMVWADPDRLQQLDVRPWAGPRSLPLWLPGPEYAGMRDRDVSQTLAAGLTPRPLADTAYDTLRWATNGTGARRSGLTPDEEQDVLASLSADE